VLNLSNYSVRSLANNPGVLYGMADRLLPKIADATGYELAHTPNKENLQGFIWHLSPQKNLQDNIPLVSELSGGEERAVTNASFWVRDSGVLEEVNRSFSEPTPASPSVVESAIITGGVARWMLRRGNRLLRHVTEGNRVGMVYIPVGKAVMSPEQHYLVGDLAKETATGIVTETDFANVYVAEMLRGAGLSVQVFESESKKGADVIADFMAQQSEGILSGEALVVANAGAAIQEAVQLRREARKINGDYDASGDQLFVISDSAKLALRGESAATHQSPLSALGMVVRSYYYLNEAARQG